MSKKKVVISGVNSGIGYATALVFAKEGYVVYGIDLSSEVSPSLALKIKTLGSALNYAACDVSNNEQVVAYFDSLNTEIDVLVNNAGIIKRIPAVDMTAAEFRQVIDIDLNGPFIVSNGFPFSF